MLFVCTQNFIKNTMKNLLLIQVQDHQVVSVQKVPPQTIFLHGNDNTIRNIISLGPKLGY